MHFELIQLYRNYRNIENVDIDIESGEAIVFGHFDRINFKNSDTADEALDILYDQYISNNTKTNEKSDVQPIALFTYDDKKIKSSAEMCTAVSFMQISKPSDCIDIKTFYEYASKAINTTISELKSQNVIDDVEANIYIPLSFMNIAVIFYAKNLTDICNVVKNILHNKIASFQYSVLSFPKDFCLQHQTDKNINISLRFIWKKHTNTKKVVDLLKDALSKAQICHYTINHLLGNNDGLLTVSGDGYKIIKMFLNKQNEFSEFIKHVENTRASIYFPDRDIKLVKLSCICESPANYVVDNSLIYVAEQELINALIDLKKSSPLLQKSDINDIIYKVTEFGKFINVVSKHARKGIATSLYLSIKSPYLLFLKIALEKIELIGTKYKRDSVLERIGSVMKDMLAYYGNIFHCNLGFFEERGFYNNIIGLASNVELAYNKYANCICDVAMSEFERNVQKLKIECSVTSDNDPVICTNDIFDNVKDQETDNSLLINVNIPVSYVFKYKSVSHIIIHEIAHYVGERKRESRAYAMCKTITAAICDVIYQGFVLSPLPSLSKNELDFLNKYEKTDAYILMHQEMKNKIYEILFNYINDSFLKKCNTSFYMNRTVNSLIEVINELPQNNDLIVSLTEELVNFQFWYYENIEDFYLQNSDDNLKSELIIQISDYALKGYNRHFAKRIILEKLQILTEIRDGNLFSELDEKSCNIYVPDMLSLIDNLYNAISESYCDIMMITLSGMTFDDYLKIMSYYGKTIDNVINESDYMTWLRINFVSIYMNKTKLINSKELPERFKYYSDINLFEYISEYLNELKSEFSKVLARCKNNNLLSNYLKSILSNDEEKNIDAIYSMFFGIN